MSLFSNIKKCMKFKYMINVFIILAALIIIILLQNFGGTSIINRTTLNIINRIGYSIILAVSLNLVVGFLGELSLGHAGFMCVGAYLGCYFGSALSKFIGNEILALIVSMIIGGLCAAFFGFVIGLPALRLKGDYLAIVTLAFGEIVRNVFKNLPFFGGPLGMDTKTIAPKTLYIVSFIVAIVMIILFDFLIRSKHGRAITAIRDNEIAARAMGINVNFYKVFVFALAAFFAGVAGVLFGRNVGLVEPTAFDFNYSIEILVMVVLGGMANVTGSIISASFITTINVLLQKEIKGDNAFIKLLVYSLILIFVIIYNNNPKFAKIREKLSIKKLISKFSKKSKDPAHIKGDESDWNRIPTKINMDEVLTYKVQTRENIVENDDDSKGAD